MTRIDELPRQFKVFVREATEVFDWEVSEAQKRLAGLNGEIGGAQTTLSDLHAQLKSARDQLSAANTHLGKASDLVSLRYQTAEETKKLAALRADLEKVTAAAAAKEKLAADLDRKAIAATNSLTLTEAVRVRNEDLIREQRAYANRLLGG
jgi:predicted  nucleic acid-binding Zn-ribbon protein